MPFQILGLSILLIIYFSMVLTKLDLIIKILEKKNENQTKL